MILADFGDLIAERMRIEHRALASRWFGRLLDLLPVDARDVFPTESLLDHIPALILFVKLPMKTAIGTSLVIIAINEGARRN